MRAQPERAITRDEIEGTRLCYERGAGPRLRRIQAGDGVAANWQRDWPEINEKGSQNIAEIAEAAALMTRLSGKGCFRVETGRVCNE